MVKNSYLWRSLFLMWFVAIPEVHGQHCRMWECDKIEAPDGSESDRFGHAVWLDGDFALVSALWDDDGGAQPATGSVYVFRREASEWVVTQELRPSDGSDSDQFGSSIASEGNVIVVGAPGKDPNGAVYVFRLQNGAWLEEQKVEYAEPDGLRTFGNAVDIDQGRIVVGDRAAERVSLYQHDGSEWGLINSFDNPRSEEYEFGYALALEDDRLVVGAPNYFTGYAWFGTAHVYRDDGNGFRYEQELVPGEFDVGNYGRAVGLCGTRIVVGASNHRIHHSSLGTLVMFEYDGNSWVQTRNQSAYQASGLGASLELDADVLVGGGTTGSMGGGVHSFRFDGNSYGNHLNGHAWQVGDRAAVGTSVSHDQGLVFAGSPGEDTLAGRAAGAVNVFCLPEIGLDANRFLPEEGDEVSISSCGGQLGERAALFAVEFDDTPASLLLGIGRFEDRNRFWAFDAKVPPGLSGLEMELESIGFLSPGILGVSNRIRLHFQ